MSSARVVTSCVLAGLIVATGARAHDTLGLCPPAPAPGCRAPVKTRLTLQKGATAERDKLRWQWRNPTGTPFHDFGYPMTSTDYALCLYDASARAQPLLVVEAPAGIQCLNGPCWEAYAYGSVWLYNDGAHASMGFRC